MKRTCTMTLVGLGNIGSCLVALLAWMPLSRVILVDRDRYEAGNLPSQDMGEADIGQGKAVAQARRLRARAPFAVRAIGAPVEDVPATRIGADVIVSCLDSLAARATVSRLSYRLGAWWVDTGVGPDGRLVRLSVFPPATTQERTCLECGFTDRHHQIRSLEYSCLRTPASGSPRWLGAAAASLAASLLDRIFGGSLTPDEPPFQVVHDLAHDRVQRSRLVRNPRCPFDHRPWRLEPSVLPPRQLLLNDLLTAGDATLHVPGRTFVTGLVCTTCGSATRTVPRLDRAPVRGVCAACGAGTLVRNPYETRSLITARDLDGTGISAGKAGLRCGDVLCVSTAHGLRDLYLDGGRACRG